MKEKMKVFFSSAPPKTKVISGEVISGEGLQTMRKAIKKFALSENPSHLKIIVGGSRGIHLYKHNHNGKESIVSF